MLDRRIEADAQARAGQFRNVAVRASPGIPGTVEIGAGTGARVHETAAPKRFESVLIYQVTLALTYERAVRLETKPREIFQNCVFVVFTTSLPIVVLDAQQHATAVGRGLPHFDRVQHVTEMQKAGRRGRKAGDDHATLYASGRGAIAFARPRGLAGRLASRAARPRARRRQRLLAQRLARCGAMTFTPERLPGRPRAARRRLPVARSRL